MPAATPRASRSSAASAQQIADAIKAASQAQEERGLLKYAPQAIFLIFVALVLWVGTTLMGLNNTVTRMSANFDQLSKSIDDLRQGQGQSSKTIGDLQASQARGDARTDAVEADITRVKERIRILEGQRPITSQDANVAR